MGLLSLAFLAMLIMVDTFPPDLTIAMALIMTAMLIGVSILLGRNKRWKRAIGAIVAFLFIFIFASFSYYLGDTYAMLNRISDAGISATGPTAKKVDLVNEPFNVYITGIDQWEEDEGLDLERSDVNMIMTVNPVTKKILLTSIPRDSYVKLHTAQQMDKLTHTGIYGVDETLNTVEDWFNIPINYYVKMNFTGAEDIINAIGGIKLYNPVAFNSSRKSFEYETGWIIMSGREALFYARERKAFEGQDAMRVENQQRVMNAVLKKLTSSSTLLTNYSEIMAAAGKNLSTNMSSDEMTSLVKMQLADLSPWTIESQKITGEYGEDYVASLTQSQKFSIYRPDEDSVASCVEKIKEIQNPKEEELEEVNRAKNKSFFVNLVKNSLQVDLKKEEGKNE